MIGAGFVESQIPPVIDEAIWRRLSLAAMASLGNRTPVVSSGGLADLTAEQQATIIEGSTVTTVDGKRWVYSGTGDKTLEASYVELSDVTPAWASISGKPTAFDTLLANIGDMSADARTFNARDVIAATETTTGVVQLATSNETITGTDSAKAVVPSALTDWWANIKTQVITLTGLLTIGPYKETTVAIGTVATANTLDISVGTFQTATLTASTACTFTMPAAGVGKSFTLLLKQAAATGNGTATFTGVKWDAAGAPVVTATAGKMDIFTFTSDGTNWYGSVAQGYTP